MHFKCFNVILLILCKQVFTYVEWCLCVCTVNFAVQDHSSKESVLQTMPPAHIATATTSTAVPNKPAVVSLPSPPVSLQIPPTNPPIEPPVAFPSGQMYPSGFPPQLWSGVTPTSEYVVAVDLSVSLHCLVLITLTAVNKLDRQEYYSD